MFIFQQSAGSMQARLDLDEGLAASSPMSTGAAASLPAECPDDLCVEGRLLPPSYEASQVVVARAALAACPTSEAAMECLFAIDDFVEARVVASTRPPELLFCMHVLLDEPMIDQMVALMIVAKNDRPEKSVGAQHGLDAVLRHSDLLTACLSERLLGPGQVFDAVTRQASMASYLLAMAACAPLYTEVPEQLLRLMQGLASRVDASTMARFRQQLLAAGKSADHAAPADFFACLAGSAKTFEELPAQLQFVLSGLASTSWWPTVHDIERHSCRSVSGKRRLACLLSIKQTLVPARLAARAGPPLIAASPARLLSYRRLDAPPRE